MSSFLSLSNLDPVGSIIQIPPHCYSQLPNCSFPANSGFGRIHTSHSFSEIAEHFWRKLHNDMDGWHHKSPLARFSSLLTWSYQLPLPLSSNSDPKLAPLFVSFPHLPFSLSASYVWGKNPDYQAGPYHLLGPTSLSNPSGHQPSLPFLLSQ